jgi:uncharacterized OB-fold protein
LSEFGGKTCPFCKAELKDGDTVKVCPVCEMAHHQECWDANGGCTTFGCSGQQGAPASPASVGACPHCGAARVEGQSFCSACGVAFPPQVATTCAGCGTALVPGQTFCPSCGQKAGVAVAPATAQAIGQYNAAVTTPKKKSKPLIPIIIVLVLVALGAGGYFVVQQNNKAAAAAKYTSQAKDMLALIGTAGSEMETIGNKIKTNWNTYVFNNGYYFKTFSSVDDAVAQAQSAESTFVDSVKSSKDEIDAAYAVLKTVPDENNKDLTKIQSQVQDLYSAYTDMYSCVIDVTGNYTSWTSSFSDTDSALARQLKSSHALLD